MRDIRTWVLADISSVRVAVAELDYDRLASSGGFHAITAAAMRRLLCRGISKMQKFGRYKKSKSQQSQQACNCNWRSAHNQIVSGSATDYIHRAETHRKNMNEGIELYRQAIEAAKKELPPLAFLEWPGHFWQISETRPYMHAKSSLGQLLRGRGDYAEAVEHLRELVRLNPHDNQGNRWHLALALLDAAAADESLYSELEQLFDRYPEPFATMVYTKALALYRRHGVTTEAKTALRQAIKRNPFVIEYLGKDYPRAEHVQDHFALDSREEALGYVYEAWHQWRRTDGVADLIAVVAQDENCVSMHAGIESSRQL